MKKITPRLLAGFILLLSLACSTIEISLGSPGASSSPAIPPEQEPPAPPTARPTLEPPLPALNISGDTVQMALIALEDNGLSGELIGCGDSLVMVEVPYKAGDDPLQTALEALLGIHERYYGQSGLYTALYQTDLQVDSLTYEGGTVFIELSGTWMTGGTCDLPRIEAQLMKTALQFLELNNAHFFINGTPLEELLSLK